MSKKQKASSSSFVPFPNPYPLIRSFSIPEPIIQRPGINPCSSLNPKPHSGYKLKPMTMAPLDVDPCAASRTEVIANTTFLTASEHAGGSLPEPPMAARTSDSGVNTEISDSKIVNDPLMAIMASDSPANSETSAPQIVNDEKIESKNAQVNRCDVCNVICNTEVMLKEHKLGKKHLKKIQKLSVSSPIIKETPLEITNVILHQESEKKEKEDFSQNEPLIVCNNFELNKFTEHLQTEKLETQATSEPLDDSSISGTEKVEDEGKVSMLLWCEVCKVSCSSQNQITRHNLGKKHLKNLKISERLLNPPLTTPMEKTGDSEAGKPRWCDICKIFRSGGSFSKHVRGHKHKKKLKELKILEGLPLPLPSNHSVEKSLVAEKRKAAIVETGKRKADGLLGSQKEEDEKRKKMVTEGGVSGGASIICRVCNVACKNLADFNDHRADKKHSAMVLKEVGAL